MQKFETRPYWSPYLAGIGLGFTLIASYFLLGGGLGASCGQSVPDPPAAGSFRVCAVALVSCSNRGRDPATHRGATTHAGGGDDGCRRPSSDVDGADTDR